MNHHRISLLFVSGVIAFGNLIGAPALAATYQWSNASGGLWEDVNNWVPRGYPRAVFDFAQFNVAAAYSVDATNAALVPGLGIVDVRSGSVALSTHDAFRAVLGVGVAGAPATIALRRGAIIATGTHTIGPAGTLVLEPGTRLESRASGSVGITINQGGTLRGDGAALDGRLVQNSGTVSPGLAPGEPGLLMIGHAGDAGYAQRASGTLEIEIGGLVPGTEYDQLRIENAFYGVSLAGTLNITLIDGFAPASDSRFDILTAPAISGTFAAVVLPEAPGCKFEVVYEPTSVALVASVSAPALAYPLDLKPAGCPNPLHPRAQGVVPAAVLGADGLDVRAIDPATLRLEGVAPQRFGYEDVSGPFSGDPCGCSEEGPDGIEDLTLKFDAPALVAAIGAVVTGEERQLTLTGALVDGRPFTAVDCVVIVGGEPGGGRRLAILAQTRAWEPWQRVSYELPAASDVRLDVFNAAGRKVAEVVRGAQPAGEHTVEWNAGRVPNGVYYYRIEAGARTGSAKLVLVR
jgi:hypothetical protein